RIRATRPRFETPCLVGGRSPYGGTWLPDSTAAGPATRTGGRLVRERALLPQQSSAHPCRTPSSECSLRSCTRRPDIVADEHRAVPVRLEPLGAPSPSLAIEV